MLQWRSHGSIGGYVPPHFFENMGVVIRPNLHKIGKGGVIRKIRKNAYTVVNNSRENYF